MDYSKLALTDQVIKSVSINLQKKSQQKSTFIQRIKKILILPPNFQVFYANNIYNIDQKIIIYSILNYIFEKSERPHIIISDMAPLSLLSFLKKFELQNYCDVTIILRKFPTDKLMVDNFTKYIKSNTILVVLHHKIFDSRLHIDIDTISHEINTKYNIKIHLSGLDIREYTYNKKTLIYFHSISVDVGIPESILITTNLTHHPEFNTLSVMEPIFLYYIEHLPIKIDMFEMLTQIKQKLNMIFIENYPMPNYEPHRGYIGSDRAKALIENKAPFLVALSNPDEILEKYELPFIVCNFDPEILLHELEKKSYHIGVINYANYSRLFDVSIFCAFKQIALYINLNIHPTEPLINAIAAIMK